MRSATMAAWCVLLLCLSAGRALAQAAPSPEEVLVDRMELRGVSVAAFARSARAGRLPARVRTALGGAARIALTAAGRRDREPRERRSTMRVCGVDATRTEVSHPAQPSGRVSDGPRHLIVPARSAFTVVAVELEHRGRRVRVEWLVRTARRAELRAIEDAFFASIRCE